jgi:hypothetical protein
MMLLPYASPLRPPRARRGLSLLEVLVSLSIFLFALIVIGRLVVMGTDLALDVQYQSQATQLCQSKMAEVLCGAVPLSSQNEVPLDEDPAWTWSLECEPSSVSGLWHVTVTLVRLRPGGIRNECTLSQMVIDPSVRGNAMDPNPPSTTTSTDSGTTTPSGSGSSTGSSTAATGGAAPAAAATGGAPTAAKSTAAPASTPAAAAPAAASTASPAKSTGTSSSSSGKKGG